MSEREHHPLSVHWQPIETAPKDGTPFVVVYSYEGRHIWADVIAWFVFERPDEDGRTEGWCAYPEPVWSDEFSLDRLQRKMAYWMPLPAEYDYDNKVLDEVARASDN